MALKLSEDLWYLVFSCVLTTSRSPKIHYVQLLLVCKHWRSLLFHRPIRYLLATRIILKTLAIPKVLERFTEKCRLFPNLTVLENKLRALQRSGVVDFFTPIRYLPRLKVIRKTSGGIMINPSIANYFYKAKWRQPSVVNLTRDCLVIDSVNKPVTEYIPNHGNGIPAKRFCAAYQLHVSNNETIEMQYSFCPFIFNE